MIEIIGAIAREAGNILLKYFAQDYEVKQKSDHRDDLVTTADMEADAFIRRRLAEEFPEDQILSEEHDNIPQDYKGRVWMVDPLDGTRHFVAGGDCFSVIIGLCINGVPTVGVVYLPARGALYYAEKGKGAFCLQDREIRKLAVSSVDTLALSRLIIRKSYVANRKFDDNIRNLAVHDRIEEGSFGTKACLIAADEADIYIHTQQLNKWDTCASQLILEEAGGRMTDRFGKELDYLQESPVWRNLVVSTNGLLHHEVVAELARWEKEEGN